MRSMKFLDELKKKNKNKKKKKCGGGLGSQNIVELAKNNEIEIKEDCR